jgi:hypothetical protein
MARQSEDATVYFDLSALIREIRGSIEFLNLILHRSGSITTAVP